jgi:hypothetical protein
MRTHSLVELTKKALYLKEEKEENKNNGKETIPKSINKNQYFHDENKVIYNNYVNGNKYINNYKSDKALFKNNNEKKYFRNYINEYNNLEKDENYKMNNIYSQMLSFKQMNLIKKKDDKKISKNNFINNEKERLLKRVNNEKINNFLGGNHLNEGKNYENKYIPNYSKINKDSYLNIIKKSIDQNKTSLNVKVFNNSNINYPKNKNNVNAYNNKRYDLLNDYKSKDGKNIMINHKSVSYINNKGNNMVNLKQSNVNKNELYNVNSLMRSSSFVRSNTSLNKIMNNFSIINDSNKENERNIINNKYVNNLNYRYDII